MIDDKEEFETIDGGVSDADGQEIIKKGLKDGRGVPDILDELNTPPVIDHEKETVELGTGTGVINPDAVTPEKVHDDLNVKREADPKKIKVLDIGKRADLKKLIKDPDADPEGFAPMQGGYDSAIACVAMVAKAEYKFVSMFIPRNLKTKFKGVPGDRIAISSQEILRMLYDLGILARQVTCLNMYAKQPGQEWRAKHANAIYEYDINDLQAYMMLGGKAILGVPGHEDKNKIHWVYAEGPNCHDPYPIKVDRYKTLHKVLIADAVIVGGVPNGAK